MSWTKENITVGSWNEASITTDTWNDDAISSTNFTPEGVLIYLACEGGREKVMSEGNLEYLMYSRLSDWSDTTQETDTWTEVNIE